MQAVATNTYCRNRRSQFHPCTFVFWRRWKNRKSAMVKTCQENEWMMPWLTKRLQDPCRRGLHDTPYASLGITFHSISTYKKKTVRYYRCKINQRKQIFLRFLKLTLKMCQCCIVCCKARRKIKNRMSKARCNTMRQYSSQGLTPMRQDLPHALKLVNLQQHH